MTANQLSNEELSLNSTANTPIELSSSIDSSDALSLLLASPTPFRISRPKIAAKKPTTRKGIRSSNIGSPASSASIPQKRQRLDIEPEIVEFRASTSTNSIFSSIGAKTPEKEALDLKKVVQDAISPLIDEIKGLKGEIQQLKANLANSASTTTTVATQKVVEKPKEALNRAKSPKKALQTTISKDIESKKQSTSILAKKPSYAGVLAKNIALPPVSQAPWTLIQKKKPQVQQLAPKKASEPCQRRLILQRPKEAARSANLADMLLALNKAIRQWGLPEHISLLKIGYTNTGAISCLLNEKAIAPMLLPAYSDALMKVAIQFDNTITGIEQAEQWYRLRVHRVLLSRYFNNPQGLQLAKEEIEATQGLSIPLLPQWLARKETILERYNSGKIKCSTIIVTVRNKLEADRLMAKGLYFGGYNHTVDRYWETGPEEICPRCLEYGHTNYRACKKPAKCYICAGDHEANEHKCPITNCTALQGKACVHLPIKCIHCKGSHLAISSSCPKRRAAIEETRAKKQAARDLAASRERIQVVIPVKKQAIQPIQMELDSEELSKQAAAQLLSC